MGIDQVTHMHIVANAGAIRRLVVRAINRQRITFTGDSVQHQRDQMGLGLVKLTDLSLRIRSGHIEITKDDMAQAKGGFKVDQDIFDGTFRRAIGIDRVLFAVFVQDHIVLIAVGRTSGRKDKVHTSRRNSRLDQVERAHDIVAPVFAGQLHAFAHLAEGSKVHHRNGLVLGKGRINCGTVHQITLDKWAELDGILPTGFEIVEGHRRESGGAQSLAGVRPDIARTARHQYMCHECTPPYSAARSR
mmetsp:Transcript_17998/g.27417  ORF Transcript_17998/g.27417 Transcript_17998/m.27417 type:complete len:246 (+) Transcript_17998:11501-12238(+)